MGDTYFAANIPVQEYVEYAVSIVLVYKELTYAVSIVLVYKELTTKFNNS
jgi:hypothetical protein